jgi:hypothetical protein
MFDITFIHTAEVHKSTFQLLITELSPELKVRHLVEESLLDKAQKYGLTDQLKKEICGIIDKLSSESRVIVCTCSTIGGIAEGYSSPERIVQRIDRAMADYAVENGYKVLVLAALESTIKPTTELINSSLENFDCHTDFDYQVVEDAWLQFTSGDYVAYYDKIKLAVEKNQEKYDMVLLAQASMAGVSNVGVFNVPVISSPRLGVERAIFALSAVI